MDAIEAQIRMLRMKGIVIKRRPTISEDDPFASPSEDNETSCVTCVYYDDCRKRLNYKYFAEEFKRRCPWRVNKEKNG